MKILNDLSECITIVKDSEYLAYPYPERIEKVHDKMNDIHMGLVKEPIKYNNIVNKKYC